MWLGATAARISSFPDGLDMMLSMRDLANLEEEQEEVDIVHL
ncbi:hypothetical protein [Paraburkholderia sp. RAU2J]|nr:hypothetical protein [Paraburkholderia sp. RAU2J]